MRIEVRIDREAPRRWHAELCRSLEGRVRGAVARVRAVQGGRPLPGAASALLALEQLVLHRGRPMLCDRVPVEPSWLAPSEFEPEVVIDCSGGDTPATAPGRAILRPLYDGRPGEDALIAAVLSGTLPELAIEDVASGTVLAAGRISAEDARGLGGGMASVASRVIMLCEQALVSPGNFAEAGGLRGRPHRRPQVAAFALRNVAADCARAIYRLCFHSPHWRIGWRWHDGPGVSERGDLGGPPWQVLGDPGTRFFADPFPVRIAGRTVVFFEDLDHRVGKGTISAVEFGPQGPVGEPVPVLEEPWHLSYPFLIKHEDALWMVPESSLSGMVPIYRCVDFPFRWERAGTLLDNIEAADCTIFPHEGRLWLMAAVRPGAGGYSDTLAIYHASTLLGPWEEHRRHPVLVDVAATRPAGAVMSHNGILLRPVQDCTRGYGRSLSLARIDRLTPDAYEQTILHRLLPGPLWPGGRLHTLNRCGPLECIDGTTYNPKLSLLRGIAETRMRPLNDASPSMQKAVCS